MSPAGADTVTKSPNSTSYVPNATVQLTATPAAGYKFVGWAGDVTGTTSPTSVTISKDLTATAKFELVSGDGTTNLIKDGNFPSSSVIATEDGTSWKLGQGTNWGNSAATSSVSAGTAAINVATIGTEVYQPQLVQYGLGLDKGMKYKLTFKAKAASARKIEASFQQAVDPWAGYASKEFDLTTTIRRLNTCSRWPAPPTPKRSSRSTSVRRRAASRSATSNWSTRPAARRPSPAGRAPPAR